jgi:hypothetical protein
MGIVANLPKPRGKSTMKLYVGTVSGPTSYTTGGFNVDTGLSTVLFADVMDLGGGEYLPKVNSITGGTVKILVRGNIEQSVNEGGSSTYTIGAEVAANTNLSGVSFQVIAVGY